MAQVFKISFKASLWIYDSGDVASWYFITLPKEYTEEIQARTSDMRRGFGSVRVSATIGKNTWQTSIFPDKKTDSYILPVKKEIRLAESLTAHNTFEIIISII
jgi:hypothetical protein